MSKPTSSRGRSEKTALQAALEAKLTGPGKPTKQAIAQAAGVSTRTVQEVLSGIYATDPSPSLGGACSPRQLRGYTEALTRLSLYAEVSAEATLASYGIDLAWTGVRQWMERVRRRQVLHRGISDPVLEAILEREDEVKAGVLLWPPFVEDDQEVIESWAWKYVARLIGALNPLWSPTPESVPTINQAVDGINQGLYDLVFGIYDTPYRRFLGLSFIHLPGLGVPLGALAANMATDISWETITNDRQRDAKRIHALVIDREVGHLFLAGACGYSTKRNLVVFDKADTAPLAAKFAVELFRLAQEGRHAILVADRLTCVRVRRELQNNQDWLKHLPHGMKGESLASYINSVALVEYSDITPIYRLGIAFRADAKRWGELLHAAQSEELFRNNLGLTAESYAELLAKTAEELRPIDFENLSSSFSSRLIKAIGERYKLTGIWKETWGYATEAPEDQTQLPVDLDKGVA